MSLSLGNPHKSISLVTAEDICGLNISKKYARYEKGLGEKMYQKDSEPEMQR
jgi:hypothetical protein